MIVKTKIKSLIEEPITGEWGEEGNGVKVIRTTNFTNEGRLDLSEIVERNIPEQKVIKKKLRLGDIILEKSGGSPNQPVGRVVYFDVNGGETYLCNNFTTVLRAKKEVHSRYLFWFLFNQHLTKNTLRFQNKTTGILNLQLDRYLESLQIPYLAFETQQKIASILDKADELRRQDQQLLAKYDELLQSIFYQMFGDSVKNEKGWKNVKLETICDVGSSRRVFVDELVETGIPFYRGTEIGVLGLGDKITPTLFITKEHYETLKKDTGVPQIGDLLLPSICPDGRIYEVQDNAPFYFKDGRVLWIKVDRSHINSTFLKVQLKQIFYSNYSKIASGTTFSELKIFELKKMQIALPPISLQNKFGLIANNFQVQKELMRQQSKCSEDLFQSLLQKAFKGELIK